MILNYRKSLRARSLVLLFIKRPFDCIASALLILALTPALLLIALIVRRDGASALFRSRRVGKGGRDFYAFKFRTMMPDAEAVLQELIRRDATVREEWFKRFKLENDPRITPIGRFLRKSSLDELPQLFNVFLGQMSLVGPRPLLPEEREKHTSQDLALYCQVRPGLTGLWQTRGRDNIEYNKRIKLNNWYVNNWSLMLDFSIIMRTLVNLYERSDSS